MSMDLASRLSGNRIWCQVSHKMSSCADPFRGWKGNRSQDQSMMWALRNPAPVTRALPRLWDPAYTASSLWKQFWLASKYDLYPFWACNRIFDTSSLLHLLYQPKPVFSVFSGKTDIIDSCIRSLWDGQLLYLYLSIYLIYVIEI